MFRFISRKMRISILLLCVIFLFSLLLFNKLIFRKNSLSGPFPYKFKFEKNLVGTNFLFDLDNDGKEEFVTLGLDEREQYQSYIHVRNSDYVLKDQENFNGKIIKIFSLNWDDKKDQEIFVPYYRNDSLFLRILDKNVHVLLKEKFLFSGKTLISEEGYKEWQGEIDQIISADIDSDENEEIIFFVNEPIAKKPRGVFVFNKNFELRWKYEIGPRLSENPIVYDFNNDEFLEILLPTNAPCNEYEINETNDEQSYLIFLNHLGQRLWKREIGGRFSRIKAEFVDMNGDGKKEVISFFSHWNETNIQPHLEIIDPLNNGHAVTPRRNLPLKNANFAVIQADRNIEKEILAFDNTGKIILLDNSLNILHAKNLNIPLGEIYICEDLNNDRLEEIFINCADGTIWLDQNLSILAKTSMFIQGIRRKIQLHHRKTESPLILFIDNKKETLYSIKKNPFYLLSYYGPATGVLGGFLLVLGLIIFSLVSRNQKYYWLKMFENFAATSKQSVFIFDQNLFLLYVNSAGCSFLNITQQKLPCFLDSLSDETKSFADKISFLRNAEAIFHQREFTFANNKIIQLIAQPIQISNFPSPYWLIIFQDSTENEFSEEAKAWSAMAQKIAHDIKNPLTSIQLSLQRLQMEYQKQDKKHVNNYDLYTNRILERIEFLKRQTRDFMKFVNLENLNLQPSNLNEIIINLFSNSIVEIPGDITLIKKLSQELPIFHLDQEQVQSVVENLITNAINAMPNGGSLTISTSMASDLQIPNVSEKRSDYVIFEIMDTGVGISDELREKLFLPFSTNTHLGTGLGLIIVKKIIEDHHGFIEVNSEVNVGTCFIIYLPVA